MNKQGSRSVTAIKFLVVVIGSLFMSVGIIYAATTIGTNISTTGTTTLGDAIGDTITVNGHIAAATTTGNLVVGIAELAAPTSTLSLYGTLHVFRGTVTTSDALWVGSAGTVNTLDLQGGDLYVQNGAEIDGNVTIGGWASTTGDLIISGGTVDVTTSTATTTVGIFARTRTGGVATSTLGVGDMDHATGVSVGCLELVMPDGNYGHCYLPNGATALVCAVGLCVPR
ncbi:MAG: hypothetical protein Q7K65_03985 [Candidatus Buchananbacteria bacterium]|nr:hypothetical protein [Candidatus Buchananbacteria bacterium]